MPSFLSTSRTGPVQGLICVFRACRTLVPGPSRPWDKETSAPADARRAWGGVPTMVPQDQDLGSAGIQVQSLSQAQWVKDPVLP